MTQASPAAGAYRLRCVVLELTNRCNLRCVHCASNSGAARAHELSTSEFLSVINDLAQLGCEEVVLIGGEVFLHSGWERIARHVVACGMRVVVVTNGLLLDEARIQTLAEIGPYSVGVSIDGADAASYQRTRGVDGFDRAMSALDALCDVKTFAVCAITSFHRGNLGEFDRLSTLMRERPVTWQVQVVSKAGCRFPEELFFRREDYRAYVEMVLDTLTREPKRRMSVMDDFGYHPLDQRFVSYRSWAKTLCHWQGCQAGISGLGIRSDGSVLPCLSLGDGFEVANLRTQSIASIWGNDAYFDRFRNKAALLTGACARCAVRAQCRGGCSDMALSTTGSLGENPYCIRAMETEDILRALGS